MRNESYIRTMTTIYDKKLLAIAGAEGAGKGYITGLRELGVPDAVVQSPFRAKRTLQRFFPELQMNGTSPGTKKALKSIFLTAMTGLPGFALKVINRRRKPTIVPLRDWTAPIAGAVVLYLG